MVLVLSKPAVANNVLAAINILSRAEGWSLDFDDDCMELLRLQNK
jgi:hypothetical protein